MERTTDVLIVGGGIVGLSVAYNLAKSGLGSVTLIERDRVGSGASSKNSGGIREQFSNLPMIKIMHYSIDLWEGLPKELSWNLLYEQKGYLMAARTEAQLQQLRANVEMQHSVGVKSRLLSAEEFMEEIPYLHVTDLVGGAFNQRDGTVHHDAVLWAFERAVKKMGVEVLEGVECRNIITASGKAVGADTTAGSIRSTAVIVAAGVYTKDLLAPLGVELPIKSYRRENSVSESYKSFLKHVFWDLTTALFLNQTLRGEVLCDTRDPNHGESRDRDASYAFAAKLASEISRFFPVLKNIRMLRQWSGLYDITPDGSPLLGRVEEVENLLPAAGFSGHGFMLAPAVGRLYAQMLKEGTVPEMLRPFVYSRFREGKQIVEPLIGGRQIKS
jgi:heterotetrameric sarcosine oxidase beta subunit